MFARPAVICEPDRPMPHHRMRLVTRSDFDGLVCAVLLRAVGMIGPVTLAEPADAQAGRVAVDARVILANLPYIPGCHLAFDHHLSEALRVTPSAKHVIRADAPSTARVIHEYFGGKLRFLTIPDDLLVAVDKADRGFYTRDEILRPTGWAQLAAILDPRSGIEQFGPFRLDHQALFEHLIDIAADEPIELILRRPEVAERIRLLSSHAEPFQFQLKRRARREGDCVVIDLREETTVFAGSRFTVYALNPESHWSLQISPPAAGRVTLRLARSILRRDPNAVAIGPLMLRHGGGGHSGAGSCVVEAERVDQIVEALLLELSSAAREPAITPS